MSSSRANTPATSNHGQAHFDARASQNVDADETYDYAEEDEVDDEEELDDELGDGKAGQRQDTRQVLRDVTNAYEATETF